MSTAAILSHGKMRAFGLAAKKSRRSADGLEELVRSAGMLIQESSQATDLAALALAQFEEEVREHKGSAASSRRVLNATFRAARWAFSHLNNLLVQLQEKGVIVPELGRHQETFERLNQLQSRYYEWLADMDDPRLQERISEAFQKSLENPGDATDWRSQVFGDDAAQE